MAKSAEALHRKSIIVVLSDLYLEPAAVLEAIALLAHRGSDIMVFHLLDPAEIDFPFEEAANYEDLESGERIPVVPAEIRDRYRALVAGHIAELTRVLGEGRVDYALFDTRTPLDHALFTFLARRARYVRHR
jgi:hypothetical protein